MGQLKIEGGAVEQLTLEKRRINQQFDPMNPLIVHCLGSRMSIPAGEYRLQKIELKGGYCCDVPMQIIDGLTGKVLREAEWLTIGPDKPCTLKAGAPLKLVSRVYCLGRVIRLGYELLDAQGRRYYAPATPRQLPRFAVYQGDREIASSDSMSLEYG